MAYSVIGLLRRIQSRLTESRIALEKGITLDPNNELANRQLGWTLLSLGELGSAFAQGQKILRLSPRDPNVSGVYLLLGWCQLVSNHLDEAVYLIVQGRTANPPGWYFSDR